MKEEAVDGAKQQSCMMKANRIVQTKTMNFAMNVREVVQILVCSWKRRLS